MADSNLADIVLDALDMPEKQSVPGPAEILSKEICLETVDIMPYLEKSLCAAKAGEEIWDGVTTLIALSYTAMVIEPPDGFLCLMIRAREADRGDNTARNKVLEDLRWMKKELEEHIYHDQREDCLWSWPEYLSYIECIYGEDTVKILSVATGTREGTARKWLEGQTPVSHNYRLVHRMAYLLYDLEHQLGWSLEEIRNWMEKPLGKLASPLESWQSGAYGYPGHIQKELRRIGLR